MAIKIIRQPKTIAVIGAPSSAAALAAGHEQAPAVLRANGLIQRLQEVGYEVADLGDCQTQIFQSDDEHPRARNLPAVLAVLNDFRPRVEQAVKSGALPLLVGGDCMMALATIAGVRRYYRAVSLVYFDGDADLNVPATTASGCLDGMVVSHIIGRGAPELVRFWGEPPLVREPDVALFGTERLEPSEEEGLRHSPMRRFPVADIRRLGPVAAAEAALERVHVSSHEFVLHFDVDAIAGEDFRATNLPSDGGLRLEEVREALSVFARQKNLAAIEVAAYNPALDPEGSAAKQLIELIVTAFRARLGALETPAHEVAPSAVATADSAGPTPPADSESPAP